MIKKDGSISDPYRNFIALSRYARWLPEQNRRETWKETVNRFVENVVEPEKLNGSEADEIHQAILNHEVMPSMRGMMTAGPALERENLASYNCSAVAVNSPRVFDEALYILMCGTGLGFSVEQQYVSQLPFVNEHFEKSDTTIVVADSKAGWARAFRELIAMLYAGQVPKIDVSKVRPAGARLKIFGGRASGPQPLVDLFDFAIDTFKRAAGRQLKPIECHDLMCKVGDVVVSGGVRRSALISLSDVNDYQMSKAKSGAWWEANPQRALANNSAVYNSKPSIGEFLREWSALYESKSGERGIFNNSQDNKLATRRDMSKANLTNPCGEILLRHGGLCVAPTTPLITKQGIFDIGTLENQRVEVWNGDDWSSVVVRNTRLNSQMVRVTFSDGSYLDCTPDHRFSVKNRFESEWREVEAQNLMDETYSIQVEPTNISGSEGYYVDDSYSLGFAVGDGCVDRDQVCVDLYGEKDKQCPVSGIRRKPYLAPGYNVERIRTVTDLDADYVRSLRKDFRQISEWNAESVLQFFAGLADADGSETGTGGIRIYISGEERARDAQLVLTKNGIRSSVNLCQPKGAETNKGMRSVDLWYLQLTDARRLPCYRLDVSNGHNSRFKGKYQNIRSVKPVGVYDAYCFEEVETHKAVFGNVLTYQCNLTEVVVRPGDSLKHLKDKVRMATLLGTIQSGYTNFKYLRRFWKNNAEEERLLGVSLTGQLGHPVLSGQKGYDKLSEWLTELREHAVETNEHYAMRFDLPVSTAITTVKPSGTVSQLTNSASGMHPWHSPYYIRAVRGDNKDPLTLFMKDQGIPHEPDSYADNVTVFYFPIAAPKGATDRTDLDALSHLEIWKRYKQHWTEHNPSITVTVRENEWVSVAEWVYRNWEDVGGISFLPYDDHTYRQAPYDEVNKEDYLDILSQFPKDIDWSKLQDYESEDNTASSQTLACSANSCELVDLTKD